MCNKQFLEVKDEPFLKNDKIWLECSVVNIENDLLSSLELPVVQRMLKNRLADPLVRYVYKNMFPNEEQTGLDKYFFNVDKENVKPVRLFINYFHYFIKSSNNIHYFALQLSMKEREKNRNPLPTSFEDSTSKVKDDTSDIKYVNLMRNVQLIMHDLEEQKLLVKNLESSQRNVQQKTENKICKNCMHLETRLDEIQNDLDNLLDEMKVLLNRQSIEKVEMQRRIAQLEYEQMKMSDEIKSVTCEVC